MSSQPEGKGGFVRAIGLFPATALNMSQMVGIGPFITIPLILAVLTGPLAIVGWVIGALIAICDGLVWAELGAAMPTAGGATSTCVRGSSTTPGGSCRSCSSGRRCW